MSTSRVSRLLNMFSNQPTYYMNFRSEINREDYVAIKIDNVEEIEEAKNGLKFPCLVNCLYFICRVGDYASAWSGYFAFIAITLFVLYGMAPTKKLSLLQGDIDAQRDAVTQKIDRISRDYDSIVPTSSADALNEHQDFVDQTPRPADDNGFEVFMKDRANDYSDVDEYPPLSDDYFSFESDENTDDSHTEDYRTTQSRHDSTTQDFMEETTVATNAPVDIDETNEKFVKIVELPPQISYKFIFVKISESHQICKCKIEKNLANEGIGTTEEEADGKSANGDDGSDVVSK